MADRKALVKHYFDEKGLNYREPDENVLSVGFHMEKIDEVKVYIVLDPDEPKAAIYSLSIGRFDQDKFAQALVACNECNAKFRWVKFSVDNDGDIRVISDAILDDETCGEECFEIVLRMVKIIDDAYPVFMKARWA